MCADNLLHNSDSTPLFVGIKDKICNVITAISHSTIGPLPV